MLTAHCCDGLRGLSSPSAPPPLPTPVAAAMSSFARSSVAASRLSFSAVGGGRGTTAADTAGVIVVVALAELLLRPNSGGSSPQRGRRAGPGGGVDGASGPECAGAAVAGFVESLERRKSGVRGEAGNFPDFMSGCGAVPALLALLLGPRACCAAAAAR